MRKSKSGNLKLALYFILLVCFFGGLSLAFKLGVILKNSSFDGTHRYNLELKKQDNCIISFSPETKKIALVKIEGETNENMNKVLSVPIDATTYADCPNDGKDITSSLFAIVPNTFDINLKPSLIDVLRLIVFNRGISKDEVTQKTVDTASDIAFKQQLLSPLFQEQTLMNEKKSIEIINSTDIPGLGARLTTLLNNIGANVVLVVTSGKPQKKSQIVYYGDDSYTLKRLVSILGFEKVKKEGRVIADIIIILGEDSINTLKF